MDSRRRDSGGGFETGRVLPWTQRRMFGPFIFFDHMGPATFAPAFPRNMDVRPHPHIGLATIWNFVFSRRDDHEFIPLPDEPHQPPESTS